MGGLRCRRMPCPARNGEDTVVRSTWKRAWRARHRSRHHRARAREPATGPGGFRPEPREGGRLPGRRAGLFPLCVNDEACRALGKTREALLALRVIDVDGVVTQPEQWQAFWGELKAHRTM